MLSQNITPEYRAMVLNKLTIMNQNLMKQTPIDPARPGVLSSRKKDISELQHPSVYNNGNNRLPTQLPNFQLPLNNEKRNHNPPPEKKYSPYPVGDNFDIDDIIDDFSQEPKNEESIDDKLKKLNMLHSKIIADKKQRRKK